MMALGVAPPNNTHAKAATSVHRITYLLTINRYCQ